jgi:hypothetical protein
MVLFYKGSMQRGPKTLMLLIPGALQAGVTGDNYLLFKH